MAENERLDVLKSPRGLRVMRFIASSPRDAAVASRLVDAMYRTLRNAAKQIPLEELLKAAATRQPGFSGAIAQCGHDFAEMIERVAADSHKDDASIAERYVDAILDRYFDQMALTLVGQEPFPTFDSFCDQASVWKASIGPALKRLASNLESGQMPRVPAQPAAVRAAEREELMALSLLTGSTQRNRHGARSQIPSEPR